MINKKGVCVDFCVGNDTHLTYSKNKIQLYEGNSSRMVTLLNRGESILKGIPSGKTTKSQD